MLIQKNKIAFINPPHTDWSLANNLTYLLIQSHYKRFGKYYDKFEWLEAPYKFNKYKDIKDIYNEVPNADIYLISSYVWNYDLCDLFAEHAKKVNKDAICILGGPHIGTNEPEFLKSRKFYDFICQPTKPGEVFIEDFLNSYIDNKGKVNNQDISWEINSTKQTKCGLPDYSIYEEHFDYVKKICNYSKEHKMEAFIVLETTRGCPYKCVYCEWGGGLDTKIITKKVDIAKRDISAMKRAGYTSAFLTDANFGAFEERDLEIFKFAWQQGVHLTDISTMKSKDLNRRKRLVDCWFEIVGPRVEPKNSKQSKNFEYWNLNEVDNYISIVPTVAIQSISDEAMKVAKRVDLSSKDKIELSKHIGKQCKEKGYPVPSLELILGMPGSTLKDFYDEMEIIWNFKALSNNRHDYMLLPDSYISKKEYLEQYKIQSVKVYTDLVDDSGVDNVHSLYKQKQNYFYTIQSCYSFTKEEMHEMFFMNQACNKLLELIYPMFEKKLTPGNFCKECFAIIKELPEYSKINNYIIDLYDINTPPKSIKKINGRFRTEIIDEMVLNNKHIIISEMFRKWI
jgi:radical SAM superfamily enzyme YgiQ (UPF0313 family)